VYRASLPIPAWVAPGSYDLELQAPGGEGVARDLVRVLPLGQTARMAFIADEEPPTSLAVAALPFDVWVRASWAPANEPGAETGERAIAGPPLLVLETLVAGLRANRALLTSGQCEGPFEQQRFEDELAGVLEREHRARVAAREWLAREAVERGAFRPLDADAQRWPEASELTWTRATLVLATSFPSAIAEITALLPRDLRLDVPEGAARELFPSAEIAASPATPARLERVHLSPGGAARVAAATAPTWRARLELPARAVESFATIPLRVLGAPARATVAWRFDERRTAYGPAALSANFTALGHHRIDALVLAEDGSAQPLRGRLSVRTAQRSGCRCGIGTQPVAPAGLLLPVLGFCLRRLSAARRKNATRSRGGIDCGPSCVRGSSRDATKSEFAPVGLSGGVGLRNEDHSQHARRGHTRKPGNR
jgi:hypothetical protein